MVVKTLNKSELPLYTQLLQQSNYPYIFQTIPYLETLIKLNQTFEIVGIFEDETLKYALPVQKKKLPGINKYFYFIPYGVITCEEDINNDIINMFIAYLKKTAIFIKLALKDKISIDSFEYIGENTTLMLDLNNDIDNIFSNFSKTHRNCTRKAIKDGVLVRIDNSNKVIDEFINLYSILMNQKQIDAIDLKFLREVISKLIKDELGFFAVAAYNDIIYNIAFISTINQHARYLYGASRRTEEKLPPIGQYLHYEIIKYLKENNFVNYDFGGIPNLPVSEEDHSYLVYKFKKGFGGEPVITHHDYTYRKFKLLKYLFK